eukprot:TRINITY_DN1355_c0_g1_i1.p1 TRINITY_DN1355_c0_g1~~TRINITY_DN1355_c0_g1_i1.p1  ORF type:complete len:119 (+),score=24.60 TRINITY_DN1355_c0_g1_i1:61-417(+)
MGKVKVTVLKASNLKIADNDSSDPYVIVGCGKQDHKTKTVKHTLDPEWNESFEFEDVTPSSMIVFYVKDKDLFKDDSLGNAILTLEGLQAGQEVNRSLHLEGDDVVSGELDVSILYTE